MLLFKVHGIIQLCHPNFDNGRLIFVQRRVEARLELIQGIERMVSQRKQQRHQSVPLQSHRLAAARQRNRDFDHPAQAMNWRYEWPRFQNHALERAGLELRVSATEGDNADALPDQAAEHIGQAAYHMEQRGEDTTLGEQAEMNAMHNEAVAQSFADQHSAADAEEEARQHQARTAAWWRNLEQRYSALKDSMHERAQEWRQRLSLQAERLRHWFGERPDLDPEPDRHGNAAGQEAIEQTASQTEPPEPER